MGDASHHTDLPFTQEDLANGDRLAEVLGDLFVDVGCRYGPNDEAKLREVYFDFFYRSLTPQEQWQRVARALRSKGYHLFGGPIDESKPCIFCGKPTGILTTSLFCFTAHEKCRQLASTRSDSFNDPKE